MQVYVLLTDSTVLLLFPFSWSARFRPQWKITNRKSSYSHSHHSYSWGAMNPGACPMPYVFPLPPHTGILGPVRWVRRRESFLLKLTTSISSVKPSLGRKKEPVPESSPLTSTSAPWRSTLCALTQARYAPWRKHVLRRDAGTLCALTQSLWCSTLCAVT